MLCQLSLRRLLWSPSCVVLLAEALCGCSGDATTARDVDTPDARPDAQAGDAGTGVDGSVVRDAVGDVGSHDASSDGNPSVVVVDVPLTGCSAAAYAAPVTIGSQTFALELDTGSTTLAVAASTCATCGVAPEYTPGAGATDEHQPVDADYGAGADAGSSGWSAEIYSDRISLGDASATMTFGAIEAQSQFFYFAKCGTAGFDFQGIVGFAPAMDALSGTEGFFDQVVASQSRPNVFATELCDPNGHLWLGGYDPAYVTAPPQFTPFTSSVYSSYSYVVDLERVEVNGVAVDVTSPAYTYTDTILDTGNSEGFLPPEAFAMVANAITASAGFRAAFGADAGGPDAGASFFSENGNCGTTTLTKAELDATLPALTLVFGSTSPISVPAVATEAYLVPYPDGVWCPALFPLAPDAGYPFIASIGAPLLRSNVVIFDREMRRIGFAPHTPCP